MASECYCCCSPCSKCHSSIHFWILVTAISYLKAHWWRMGLRAYLWPSKLDIYRAWCPFVCFSYTCHWATGYGIWRFKKWYHTWRATCHLSLHVCHRSQCLTHWWAFSVIKWDYCKVSSMCPGWTHLLINSLQILPKDLHGIFISRILHQTCQAAIYIGSPSSVPLT